MSSVQFEQAQSNLTKLTKDPGNDAKLKLYGLFKQATIGNVNTAKPGVTNFVGRAKWNAWNELKNKSKAEAEKEYISYVNQLLASENISIPGIEAVPEINTSKNEVILNSNYKDIEISILHGKIFKITMNRPEKLNSISGNMYFEIIQALNEANNNENISVCCLTGKGKYFSSGNDLKNYVNSTDDPEVSINNGIKMLERFINTFIEFDKPLIALVNGPAVGIAFTILALFDLVLASDKATFAAPFTELALSPEGCSSYTFPKLMGKTKANEILLFNKKLTAKEAYERNLVTEIIPDAQFQEEVSKKLEAFSKLSHTSLIDSKSLVRMHEKDQLLKVNASELRVLAQRFQNGEFMESVMRFLSKPKSKL